MQSTFDNRGLAWPYVFTYRSSTESVDSLPLLIQVNLGRLWYCHLVMRQTEIPDERIWHIPRRFSVHISYETAHLSNSGRAESSHS
jgi:hypothetical protein